MISNLQFSLSLVSNQTKAETETNIELKFISSNYLMVLQAEDKDTGVGGNIHYTILSKEEDESELFGIHPETGQVRVKVTGGLLPYSSSNKVFGFDVKASDDGGRPGGHSIIANVFVNYSSLHSYLNFFPSKYDMTISCCAASQIYVTEEEEQAVVTINASPEEVEESLNAILR